MNMKKTLLAAACSACALDASAASYQAANAKFREADMVFVMVPSEFFGQAAEAKGKTFNAIRACAKAAKLTGDMVLVANDKGRLRSYADARYTKFLQPLDWAWLKPRMKQTLSCRGA